MLRINWGKGVAATSDNNYPELGWASQIRAQSAQDCPHFRHQLRVQRSPGHPHIWPTVYKFGDSQYPLRFNNSLEFRKPLYIWLKYYHSKKIQIRTNRLMHRVRSEGFQTQNFPLHEVRIHCPPCISYGTIHRALPTQKAYPWNFIMQSPLLESTVELHCQPHPLPLEVWLIWLWLKAPAL